METEISINDAVTAYLKLRETIREREEQFKQELEVLKQQQKIVSDFLLGKMSDMEIDSMRTPFGTVSRRVSSRYWTNDWESFYEFVRENDAPYLLERRIHNSNMKEFLEMHPDKFPVGMQNDREYVIQVRKPTAK